MYISIGRYFRISQRLVLLFLAQIVPFNKKYNIKFNFKTRECEYAESPGPIGNKMNEILIFKAN
jgi:hypothetical protein